jgi:hypothetical protein
MIEGPKMNDHHRDVTLQEFFALVGLLLLAAMFPAFAMITQFPSFLSLQT